jgi:hypothetical protein
MTTALLKSFCLVFSTIKAQHASCVATTITINDNAHAPIMVDAVLGSPCRTKPVGLSSPKLSELAAFLFLLPVFPLRPG